MFGRGLFGAFALVVAIAIVAGIGIGVYNAGVSEGVAEAARVAQVAGDGAAVVYPPYVGPYGYGHGWGWHGGPGFGIFGFLFGLFFLFLLFGLLRAAFGGGRHWGGPGGWGPGGRGGWGNGDHGEHPWERAARDRHEAWHREQRGESGDTSTARPSTGTAGA